VPSAYRIKEVVFHDFFMSSIFHVFPESSNGMDIEQVRLTYTLITLFQITVVNKWNTKSMIIHIKAKNEYNGSKKWQPFVYFPGLSRICTQ